MTLLGVSTFVTFYFYLLFYVRLLYDFLQEAKLLARKADRTASQQTSNYRLLLFSRYCALGLLGSRVWPCMVTWCLRSRDHLISLGHFLSVVLQNGVSISSCSGRIGGHEFDLWGLRDVISHVTIWFLVRHFLLVVLCSQASISNGFRNIQWRMWRSGWHDLNTIT